MKRFVEGLDRGQSTLFPASLDDYVTEDNPVRAVDVFVDGLLGDYTLEPHSMEVQRLDKRIDHMDRIVLAYPILQAFRQERQLGSVRAFNETSHPYPPHQETEESHPTRDFSHSHGQKRLFSPAVPDVCYALGSRTSGHRNKRGREAFCGFDLVLPCTQHLWLRAPQIVEHAAAAVDYLLGSGAERGVAGSHHPAIADHP